MRFRVILAVWVVLALSLSSATSLGDTQSGNSPTLQGDPGQPVTGGGASPLAAIPTFTDVAVDSGITVSGNFLAWGDYNSDGYQDLLVNGNHIYRNDGPPGWDFTRVTPEGGISGGSYGTWADYDNDRYLDFFAAGSGKLFRNGGPPNWGFTDVTNTSRIEREGYQTGAGWADYDRDGFVDLYILRGEYYDEPSGTYTWYPNRMWHNNGDGTFSNVTKTAGVNEDASPKYGRGASWADYNNDGWQDLYVSNYRQLPNYLYKNDRDGTFTNVASSTGTADAPQDASGNPDPFNRPGHSVGAAWGDIDNDGDLDLWVTNLNHKDARTSDDSPLYLNSGSPDYTFTNIRATSGIPVKPYFLPEGDELFVGCAFADFDNDGYLDLFLPQIYEDIDYAYSYVYRNNGDNTFTDVTETVGIKVYNTYAGAWADFDNDGDLDLATAGQLNYQAGSENRVRLYRNGGNVNNWLHISLRGVDSNTAAIGARVKVTAGSRTYIREVEGGMGPHGSQNSLPLEFGLGGYGSSIRVDVTWPNGMTETFHDITANQRLKFFEPSPDLAVSSVSFSDDLPYQGTTVMVRAAVSNLGTKSAASAFVSFYYESVGGTLIGRTPLNGSLAPGESATVSVPWHTADAAGEREIFAVVGDVSPNELDPDNNVGSENVTVREFNAAPQAVLTTPSTRVFTGDVVTFDGSNSTDDTQPLRYLFDYGDGTTSGWLETPVSETIYTVAGNVIASLKVMDKDGKVSSPAMLGLTVDMKPNSLPEAVIDSVSPNPAKQGMEVVFAGHGTDGDGHIAEYRWTSSLDGHISPKSSFATSSLSQGTHTITFDVKDDDGDWSAGDVVTLTVNPPNVSPTALIDSVEPLEAEKGTKISFAGRGEDPDGAVVEYLWESDIGGVLSHSAAFGTKGMATGLHTVTFRVKDDNGAWSLGDTAQVRIRPKNALPSVSITGITPDPAIEGDTVAFSGQAQDDGYIVSYLWTSSIDGFLSDAVEFGTTRLTPGLHNISFQAWDDKGAVGTVNTTLTVKPDTVPLRAAILTAEPDHLREGVAVQFVGEGTDDKPLMAYEWTSSLDGFLSDQRSFVTTDLGPGTHTVSFRVQNDREVWSEPATTTVTVLTNRAPQAVVFSPWDHMSFTTAQIVVFNATGSSDPDGDPLAFTWTSDLDGVIGTQAGFATTLSRGNHTITLVVEDNFGATARQDIHLMVQEPAPPTAPPPPSGGDAQGSERQGLDAILFGEGSLVPILLLVVVVGLAAAALARMSRARRYG